MVRFWYIRIIQNIDQSLKSYKIIPLKDFDSDTLQIKSKACTSQWFFWYKNVKVCFASTKLNFCSFRKPLFGSPYYLKHPPRVCFVHHPMFSTQTDTHTHGWTNIILHFWSISTIRHDVYLRARSIHTCSHRRINIQ